MLELNPLITEHISPNIMKETSADGDLVIFALKNPKGLTEWESCATSQIARWSPDHAHFVLYDLHRAPGWMLYNHIRASFDRLYTFRPEVERYVAVILPERADLNEIDLLLRVHELFVPSRYRIHWKLFDHRKDALAWLFFHAAAHPNREH